MTNCAIFRLIGDFISQHKSEIIAKGAAIFKLEHSFIILSPKGRSTPTKTGASQISGKGLNTRCGPAAMLGLLHS